MTHNRINVTNLVYSLAILITIALSLQYPFNTSFPIGGDAPFHVEGAQKVLNVFNEPIEALSALQETWYPASHIIFSSSGLLPISWPERFTWFITLGQISTGLAISLLLWRIAGWKSAMIGLWIWGLTSTGITRNFEDGTLAQLLSLALAALYFERLSAKSTFTTTLLFIATTLTHPITGLTLFVSNLVSLPATWVKKNTLDKAETKQLYALTIVSIASLLVLLIISPRFASVLIEGASDSNVVDLMGLYFASFIIIAPVGGIVLLTNHKISPLTRTSVTAFASLSLLLAANNFIGIDVWTERLRSQFVLAVTILASLALPIIINSVFKKEYLKTTAILLILIPSTIHSWNDNNKVYRFYENEDNYARPRLGEIADIQWMSENLPPNSTIYSNISDRTTEWIPLLTKHKWIPNGNLEAVLKELPNTNAKNDYVFFLKDRDEIPTHLLKARNSPEVHITPATMLYKL